MRTTGRYLQSLNQSICLLVFTMSAYSERAETFFADMFINECVRETWYIFSGENPTPVRPYVLISMCHAKPVYENPGYYQDSVEVKGIARFTSHAFRLDFVNIKTSDQVKIWQAIYERLIITSIQREGFHQKVMLHETDYYHYSAVAFKLEFLRSRWNIDEISLYESHAAYDLLKFGYNEGHMPYSIERKMNRDKNISDLAEGPLYYRVISGRGHRCKHHSIYSKLQSLTLNFNAYDRLFCDAFDYHGLHFSGYWNSWDFFWLRARFIREDIVSAFPPEASKAVYFASPMITFIVLKREPVTWLFTIRPFPASLWGLIILTVAVLRGVQIFRSFVFIVFQQIGENGEITFVNVKRRFINIIQFIENLHRTVLCSTYGSMILLGILCPLYTWTPESFKELNYTKNYKICTLFHDTIKHTHLIDNFILSGVSDNMWEIRKKNTPAEYFLSGEGELGDETDEIFKAALMYDDKMNLWLKGREFLNLTYSIFDKIKPANDKVLSEIRYVSVAAGATRLHFLVDTIKWGFTCGVWMRYVNLENNYYRNVAPLIVERMKNENTGQISQTGEDEGKRPLTWNDLYSCFFLNGIGLSAAWFVAMCEHFVNKRVKYFTY